MDIKIAITYHKDSLLFKFPYLIPIHAGKEISSVDLCIQGDNDGDNISYKNPWYCELTALYWLWKNTTADYKGLIHYRRCFCIKKNYPLMRLFMKTKFVLRRFTSIWHPYNSAGIKLQYHCSDTKEYEHEIKYFTNKLKALLNDGTNIIVPHPGQFYIELRRMLAWDISSVFIKLLDDIIQKEYTDFYPYYDKAMNGLYFYNANMSIMDNATFEEYCNLLFSILKRHEEETISRNILTDLTEKAYLRVSGYLGELITNAFIQYSLAKRKKLKILPIIFYDDQATHKKIYTSTEYNLKNKKEKTYFNTAIEQLKGLWHSTVHHTRKNIHLIYYTYNLIKYFTPNIGSKKLLQHILSTLSGLPTEEQTYIKERVNYYCKFTDSIYLPHDAKSLKDFTLNNRFSYINKFINSVYFFDAYEFINFFPKQFKWAYNPGDISETFSIPEITKSRPITSDDSNRNNILLNLDKVRHFTWVKDPFTWEEKQCCILFRGDINNKPRRIKFLEMWQQHPLCDVCHGGDMSIYSHLHYRYIMSLEGNDVASNLKWVMSSNSVAVMPRPTCETWYMEGKLIPNYHYIEIASDYHDLIDRIMYYEKHPEDAKAITEHAHEWVKQFQNKKREKLISLMVLDKYFQLTGQKETKS